MARNNFGPVVFGLDIGIASVGWAVLSDAENTKHIIDLGVRCFDKAETAKEGDPLNLIRRTARLTRHRLQNRAWRLTKLARLLKRQGLIPSATFFTKSPGFSDSTWELRKTGLDRLLSPEEWARVIYHLCKHRGFHWMSKAQEAKADSDAEGGKVKQSLKHTEELMTDKQYRSAAEMILTEFPDAQRNKGGEYAKALSRILLGDELALLFATQRDLGNPHAGEAFEAQILGAGDRKSGLFWQQKPALSGANLLKMLGHCTFEKTEYRAAKASFSAERHVWLTRLINLRIIEDGKSRPLTADERNAALLLPYLKESCKYKTLKTAMVKDGWWSESVRFAGLSAPKDKDPEDQILIKMPVWHELRKAFVKANKTDLWQRISTPALEGDPSLLDAIGTALSIYKDGDELVQELHKLPLPEPEISISILEKMSFSTFSNLSLKALRKILPLMETGLRYDEAVAQIPEYSQHSQLIQADGAKHLYLPPFYEQQREYKNKNDRVGSMKFREDADIPRNPVVLRALNQARKVVNALIREYGSPVAVHIEMARDLSHPLNERRKIENAQLEFRQTNQKAKDSFVQDFGYQPSGREFEKWLLYKEQLGECAYSQQPLDLNRLISDRNYTQIDHVLPYSRSYDNSKNNKVLVLTQENQNKGNRTPYEYLTALDGGQEGPHWRNFEAWVTGNKAYRQAKRNRLLRKHFGDDESSGFIDRNLNDTRYICRFFKNYVETHLFLDKNSEGKTSKRCVVVNGQLTAFLRARWGLAKIRSESDRHHALDAAVVAACSHGMVQQLARYAKRNELAYLKQGFADPQTGEIINPAAFARGEKHFPVPWEGFRDELYSRLYTDDLAKLKADLGRLGTYTEAELARVRTLFVSRAVQRRNGGAAHKETIYAKPQAVDASGGIIEKIPLTSLKLQDFDKLLDPNNSDHFIDPHRNERLYASIRKRLEDYGGKADKAFGPDNPFYKPDKNNQPTGPQVRSIKLVRGKQSGIPIRGGQARNDSMLRVDVFSKGGKFHLVPVYVHHRVTGLPNRAIVAFKDESQWTLMDEGFAFLFSLYPNDLVRVQQKGKPDIWGYFASAHRGTGAISIWLPDRSTQASKNGAIEGIGVKTALALEKFNVDILGRIYPAFAEPRSELA